MPEPLDYRPREPSHRRRIGVEGTAASILVAGVFFVTAYGYLSRPAVNRGGRFVRPAATTVPASQPFRTRP